MDGQRLGERARRRRCRRQWRPGRRATSEKAAETPVCRFELSKALDTCACLPPRVVLRTVAVMAWTNDDLTAIETAIKSGQLTVSYRDRSVTYRSLDDLLKIRALIRSDLGSSSSFESRGRYVEHNRDLES